MEVTQRMLVKQPKCSEGLGDRSNTVLTVSVDIGHAWPVFVVFLRAVVLGPQGIIRRSHLDGER